MKKFSLVVFMLCLMVGIMGCSSETTGVTGEVTSGEATSGTSETIDVYYISPMIGGSAWGNAERGFLDACADFGFNGVFMGPVTPANTTEMVELGETAVSNNADILIGAWNDKDAYIATLQRAKDNSIPIVGVNYTIENYTQAVIGMDPKLLGTVQAETLVENFPEGEQIRVVYMQGRFASQIHTDIHTAFLEALMEMRPDSIEVSWEECNSNIQEANEKAGALLLRDSTINAFVLNDGNGSIGLAALVQERGLQDTLYLQTMDGGPEVLQGLTDGYIDKTVVQDWYAMGVETAQLAKDILEGKEVPESTPMDVYAFGPEGCEEYAIENNIDWSPAE